MQAAVLDVFGGGSDSEVAPLLAHSLSASDEQSAAPPLRAEEIRAIWNEIIAGVSDEGVQQSPLTAVGMRVHRTTLDERPC
jgi:hypothetical protein